MSAYDVKRLASLDRALETLEGRREATAKRLAALANEFRRATLSDDTGVWRRNMRHGSNLHVQPLVSADEVKCVRVSTQISTRDGSDEYISDTIPLAYLEGTMSLDDAIAPIIAARRREHEKRAAAARAAELDMLAKLQAKYQQ